MRRPILFILLAFVLAVSATVTLGLGLVLGAPFHPGQGMFQVQFLAEQALETLTVEPSAQANLYLDLLARRTADLAAADSPEAKNLAFNYLSAQLDDTLAVLAALPETISARIRARFQEELVRIQTAFGADVQTDGLMMDFRVKVTYLQAAAADLNRPLSQLLTSFSAIPEAASQALTGQVALLNQRPTPGSIDPPHVVNFPAGSVGAMHAFFPLSGKHAAIDCQACHSKGLYAGTPKDCVSCHQAATPPNHYQADCALCHSTTAWNPAIFNHKAVDTSNCVNCHQKNTPANHWSGQCSLCHNVDAWKPASFNHSAAGATDCVTCHTKDKPANHFNGQCSQCHSTSSWTGASFNHAAQNATDCQSCHSNKKPANHFDGQCSQCHNTSSWGGASFNHAAQNATDCQSCHSNKKPANHFAGQCSQCHNTSSWGGASFNHAAQNATDCQSCHSNKKPANHFAGQCSQCHSTSSWAGASFNHAAQNATDCQSCHSKDKPANHFAGQCSQCHTTSSWGGATFNHTFPLNHGGANGQCAQCHPSGGSAWTCFNCHKKAEMDQKHNKIPNYATRCMECHANGKSGD
jgi:hypothetical protein